MLESVIITHHAGLEMVMPENRNCRESLKCLLASNPLRKEYMKMINFTTINKNKEEDKKSNSKNAMKSNMIEVTKSPKLQTTMKRRFGMKSFQSISHNLDL